MAENQWILNNNQWYYCGAGGAMVKNQWVQTTFDVWYKLVI